jgi:hypothetical protein
VLYKVVDDEDAAWSKREDFARGSAPVYVETKTARWALREGRLSFGVQEYDGWRGVGFGAYVSKAR